LSLPDEFQKFLNAKVSREEFLMEQIHRAIIIMKKAHPFLITWHESAHAGMGEGALKMAHEMADFIKDLE
jgi:hypothetical protein